MSNKTDNIFSNTSCPTEDILLQYVKGTLNNKEKRAVEEHLADCEMCNDEIEGLTLLSKPEKIDNITLELNAKIDSLIKKEKKSDYGFFFKIAATIVLVLGLSVIIYYQANNNKDKVLVTENIPVGVNEENNNETLKDTFEISKKTGLLKEKNTITKSEKIISDKDVLFKDSEQSFFESQKLPEETKNTALNTPTTTTVGKSIVTGDAGIVKGTAGYTEYRADAETGKVNAEKNLSKDEASVVLEEDVKKEREQEPILRTISTTEVIEKTELAQTSGKKRNAKEDRRESSRNKASDDGEFKPASPVYDAVAATETPTKEDISGGLNLMQEAIDNAKEEKFSEAIKLFESVPLQSVKDETALFYKALCYYMLNTPQKAFTILKEIEKNNKSEVYNDIKWYYALTLISLNRKADAKVILEDIIKSNSPYAPNASKELEKIK